MALNSVGVENSASPTPLAAPPKGSYAANFVNTWQKRISQAQAAGIDVNQMKPIIRADWQRVKNGSSPYSNIEAGLAVHSVMTGKPTITVNNRESGGGIIGGITNAIGNIPSDIGEIASGLNPATLLPALYRQGEQAVTHPEKLLKPLSKLAGGDIQGALKSASRTPLIDLIPGVYTANNIAQGDWKAIEEHPVMTGLDVLPYASSAGKLAMLGKAVEGSSEAAALEAAGKLRGTVEPSSAEAALLEGKPLKAGFRAVGGTTDSPLSQRWFRAQEAAKAATPEGETAALPKVYRTSDVTARMAEALGVDKETRELNRLHNIVRRVGGDENKAVWDENFSWVKDLSPEDRKFVLDKAQRYKPGTAEFDLMDPQLKGVIEHFRQHADQLAEPFVFDPAAEAAKKLDEGKDYVKPDLSDKRFIAIPDERGVVDYYPIGSKIGKAFQDTFKTQEKLGPLEAKLAKAEDELTYAAAEGNGAVPEDLVRQHDRAEQAFNKAKKDVEKAKTEFNKRYKSTPPARYGELLKDEFRGRMGQKVDEAARPSETVYRRTDASIADDLSNPQGAFVTTDPRDFEVAGEGRPLTQAELRPKLPLHVKSNAFEGLGEATLRHFQESEAGRVVGDRAASGDIAGAIDYAEHNLGVEFTAEEKAAMPESMSSGQMQDIVGAKLAKKYGHDVIYKDVNIGTDTANPTWRAHEATVLDKSALHNPAEPTITAEQATKATEAITENNFGYLVDNGIITKEELHGVMQDVMSNWQELIRAGYDPVYVPFVPESKVPYLLDQKPLAGNLYTPRQFLSKETLSFAPQAQDLAVGMTSYAVELMKQQGSLEMFNAVKSLAVTEKQLADKFGVDKARRILANDYVPYSETAGRFLSKPQMSLIPDVDKLHIPRVLNKNLDRMMNTFERDGMFGLYDKGMKVYKFAVLTGPRHVAHVLFGGLAMMMGEHGITAFPKFFEALKIVREGKIDAALSRGLDYFTPEELATAAQGKTMGRIMAKAAGSPFRALKTFEELTADTQRVMTMLRELDKGASHGLDAVAAHEQAIKLTNKVYMDIDGLAPVERTVLRHVFPFYAFTKHIIRYVLNYPADHPWRAATLANIARIEQEDHSSGLPSFFNDFFFLGHPDENGDQSAIDVKNLNPFRSLDGQNPLTLAGFLSALSPAITAPAQLAGLNTLTATPDLYPTLDYDPRTGKLVASHPDAIPQLVQTLLPPSGAIQGLLGLSENWRQLKKSDPNAYNRALMSSMNLPFIPQTRNKPLERSKAELSRYQAAQRDLSAAMRTGDTGKLSRYNVIPFQGELVPSSKLIELIKRLKEVSPTGSPATILPRSSGKGSLGAALVSQ